MSCNSLTTLSPLINLLRLKEVDASGNRISELRLDVPESFLGLNRLNLQGNVLRSISFPTDNGLQLEVLNLSDNQLKSVHGVENLSLLRELYLGWSPCYLWDVCLSHNNLVLQMTIDSLLLNSGMTQHPLKLLA